LILTSNRKPLKLSKLCGELIQHSVGWILRSAIVIENVFVLPGIGRLIFQAIANRDLIVVRDVVMLLSAMVILINFFIDLLYAWIDPRLKTGTPAV
jgi:peptide/nickel transport system permease protein